MIEALAVITLVVVAVIVLVVAYHLIGIYWALKRGADHLEQLAVGLAQVRTDTAPLNGKVDTINAALGSLVAPLLGANGNLAAIVRVATQNKA